MTYKPSANERAADKAAVVTKAVLRSADRLGLTAKTLSQVLGVSEPTISRMKKGAFMVQESSKEFELAVLLIRVFRSLDAIVGGDGRAAKDWMNSENTVLGDQPKNRITSISGLMDVIAYLDSRRAVL
ncbi:MbcA/ParS/Xre antitoxin family protein [Sneathiella glossodoripedis]|uniref:MbcA/ParS/Xre antitoxin family protein n=1 Tax=Sneathiella glossodoripedis TaxID=418853 RepID=UPI0004728646|nr:antitoxin Xre-like helix-turn-helix domain-containing protein [Sneathiella glossodoripedis]